MDERRGASDGEAERQSETAVGVGMASRPPGTHPRPCGSRHRWREADWRQSGDSQLGSRRDGVWRARRQRSRQRLRRSVNKGTEQPGPTVTSVERRRNPRRRSRRERTTGRTHRQAKDRSSDPESAGCRLRKLGRVSKGGAQGQKDAASSDAQRTARETLKVPPNQRESNRVGEGQEGTRERPTTRIAAQEGQQQCWTATLRFRRTPQQA